MEHAKISARQLARRLSHLVFPVQCAGCGQWDVDVCQDCWLLADEDPHLSAVDDAEGTPGLSLWSMGAYNGRLRNLIIGAKHDEKRDLTEFLFHCGARLGHTIALDVQEVVSQIEQLWVVPAPSSWKRRWNGHEVTGDLARGVAAGIVGSFASPPEVLIVPAVSLRWGSGSQSARGDRQRRQGRVGSMVLRSVPPPATPVIIVDDVAATGATLLEVSRCLGGSVLSAAVLAAA